MVKKYFARPIAFAIGKHNMPSSSHVVKSLRSNADGY